VTELFPHVVILEVVLPTLDGLEVTRQLRFELPDLKILFLTGNQFPQMVHEAFDIGPNGYVIKSDAPNELLLRSEPCCKASAT
jgi:DNA-binding NarL/FixJ family response regulator